MPATGGMPNKRFFMLTNNIADAKTWDTVADAERARTKLRPWPGSSPSHCTDLSHPNWQVHKLTISLKPINRVNPI
jgi:hypothetical protein